MHDGNSPGRPLSIVLVRYPLLVKKLTGVYIGLRIVGNSPKVSFDAIAHITAVSRK